MAPSENPVTEDILQPMIEAGLVQDENEDEKLKPPTHGFSKFQKAKNRKRNKQARESRKAQRARAKGK